MIDHLTERMNKSLESLKRELGGLRAGRAHVSLLDGIRVSVYGSLMPLSQIGTVSAPESRLLSIQVWDKSNIKAVEKALVDSDLGLTPQVDGQLIRLPLPELSEERRRDLVKIAAKYVESAKIGVRNIRRDGMEQAKKDEKQGDISEDERHKISQDIQNLTDKYIHDIDTLYSDKERDIMTL